MPKRKRKNAKPKELKPLFALREELRANAQEQGKVFMRNMYKFNDLVREEKEIVADVEGLGFGYTAIRVPGKGNSKTWHIIQPHMAYQVELDCGLLYCGKCKYHTRTGWCGLFKRKLQSLLKRGNDCRCDECKDHAKVFMKDYVIVDLEDE